MRTASIGSFHSYGKAIQADPNGKVSLQPFPNSASPFQAFQHFSLARYHLTADAEGNITSN